MELVLDTLLPAVEGKDDDVVIEGALVDAVLVVPVRLAVVVEEEEESYCKNKGSFLYRQSNMDNIYIMYQVRNNVSTAQGR
jgi:hypothetical protein